MANTKQKENNLFSKHEVRVPCEVSVDSSKTRAGEKVGRAKTGGEAERKNSSRLAPPLHSADS